MTNGRQSLEWGFDMTRREAIEILEEVKLLDDSMYAYNPAYEEALDMAITALKDSRFYSKKEKVEYMKQLVKEEQENAKKRR